MNREVYRHLFATYGRNPAQWFGIFLEALHVFIIRVYIVVIMAQVTVNIAAGDIDGAKRHVLYFLVAYIAGMAIGTIGELVSHQAENNQYGKLVLSYHKKLISKDMSFYRDNQTGYLTGAFRQYVDTEIFLVRFWRSEALATAISLTIPIMVLLVANMKVGLVALAVVAVQVAYVVWASSKAHKYREATHEIYRKLTGEVSDEITNIVALKSGGVEKEAYNTVTRLTKKEMNLFWLRRKTTTLLDIPRGMITALGISAAVYLIIEGAHGRNPEALGLIVLTLTYMFQIIRNVATLPGLVTEHDDLVTKIYPTLNYLSSADEKIRDPDNPQKLTIKKAAVDIAKVSFSYPSHSKKRAEIPVFKNLNIHVAGGEQVGIVGLSGAGKSTLANLLLRFDDIKDGSISIDGIDIRDVKQSELRQNIAYVPQEPLLFHRSIKENITYYHKASDDDIIRASKAAHAHEFIQKLPDGYDTIVGERGVKLSGGQKQRVVIARAVLKKAPIILFDEATSALDSESEQIIQQALPEILGKQTAIIIAHRLSTVAGLDRIIVMHDGKVVEQGTHKELLDLGGRYFSLWLKQTMK